MVGKKSSDLPPGFRFHPTDEELIMYYLRNQATTRPCPVSIIPEVDIYKFDPWELPEKAEFGENEWYFFTPRDRKYPNGVRPNRASVSGYWKATGTDKAIYSGSKYVGVKKALVFYMGKPPKGIKTGWIMHEYRLSDSISQTKKQSGSMRLDDWVLCRIYKKKSTIGRVLDPKVEDLGAQIVTTNDSSDSQMLQIPRICSLSHLWKLDCLGSLPQLLNENSYHLKFDYQTTMGNAGNFSGGIENFKFGDQFPYQYMDSVKFEASHSSNAVNQPIFVNPAFQFQ
ncbi:NAC domain-containing protein 1-like [Actinidia eriantha]|uniref:NAC domain-containing protein 1-like n=1 Tax=Actinidia eriantha TaxID=165200 RepID=UPI00259054C2|nr:NAC domain-containing protein 1-like [Actinidia eriantha]